MKFIQRHHITLSSSKIESVSWVNPLEIIFVINSNNRGPTNIVNKFNSVLCGRVFRVIKMNFSKKEVLISHLLSLLDESSLAEIYGENNILVKK